MPNKNADKDNRQISMKREQKLDRIDYCLPLKQTLLKDNQKSERSAVTSRNRVDKATQFRISPQSTHTRRITSDKRTSGNDEETIDEKNAPDRIRPFTKSIKSNRHADSISLLSRSESWKKESNNINNSVSQLDAISNQSELFNCDKFRGVQTSGKKHKGYTTKKSWLKLDKRARTLSKLRRKWLAQVSEMYVNNAMRKKYEVSTEQQVVSEETKNNVVPSKTVLDFNREVEPRTKMTIKVQKKSKLKVGERASNCNKCRLIITVKRVPDSSSKDVTQKSINSSVQFYNMKKNVTATCSKNYYYLKKANDSSNRATHNNTDSKEFRIYKILSKRCFSERYKNYSFKTDTLPPLTNMAVWGLPKVKGRRKRNRSFVRRQNRSFYSRANESKLSLRETNCDKYLSGKNNSMVTAIANDKKIFIKKEEKLERKGSDSNYAPSNHCPMNHDNTENTFTQAPTRKMSTTSNAIDLNTRIFKAPKIHYTNQRIRVNESWVKYFKNKFSIRNISKQSIRQKSQTTSREIGKIAETTRPIKNCNRNTGGDSVERNVKDVNQVNEIIRNISGISTKIFKHESKQLKNKGCSLQTLNGGDSNPSHSTGLPAKNLKQVLSNLHALATSNFNDPLSGVSNCKSSDQETNLLHVLEQEPSDNRLYNGKLSKRINCNFYKTSTLEKIINELEVLEKDVQPSRNSINKSNSIPKFDLYKNNANYSNSVGLETKTKSDNKIKEEVKPNYPKKSKYHLPRRSKPFNSDSDLSLCNNILTKRQCNSRFTHSGSSESRESDIGRAQKSPKCNAQICRKNNFERGEKNKLDNKLVIIHPLKRQNILIKCRGKLNLYVNKEDDFFLKDDFDDTDVKTSIDQNYEAFKNETSDEIGKTNMQRCAKKFHGTKRDGKTNENGEDLEAKKPCSAVSQQSYTSRSNRSSRVSEFGDFIKNKSNCAKSYDLYVCRERLSSKNRLNDYNSTSDYGSLLKAMTCSKQTGRSRTFRASIHIIKSKLHLGETENVTSTEDKCNPDTSDANYEVYSSEYVSPTNAESSCPTSSKVTDSNQHFSKAAVRCSLNKSNEESTLTDYKSNTSSDQTIDNFSPVIDQKLEPISHVAGKTQKAEQFKTKLLDKSLSNDIACSNTIRLKDVGDTFSNKLRPLSKRQSRQKTKSRHKKQFLLLTLSEQEFLKDVQLKDQERTGLKPNFLTETSFDELKNKTFKWNKSSSTLGMRISREQIQSVRNYRGKRFINGQLLDKFHSDSSINSEELNISERKRNIKTNLSTENTNCFKQLADAVSVVARVDNYHRNSSPKRCADANDISHADSDSRLVSSKMSTEGSEIGRKSDLKAFYESLKCVHESKTYYDNTNQLYVGKSLVGYPCSTCSSIDLCGDKDTRQRETSQAYKNDNRSAKFTHMMAKNSTNESSDVERIREMRNSSNKANQNEYDEFTPSKKSKTNGLLENPTGTGKIFNIWKTKLCRSKKKEAIKFQILHSD